MRRLKFDSEKRKIGASGLTIGVLTRKMGRVFYWKNTRQILYKFKNLLSRSFTLLLGLVPDEARVRNTSKKHRNFFVIGHRYRPLSMSFSGLVVPAFIESRKRDDLVSIRPPLVSP